MGMAQQHVASLDLYVFNEPTEQISQRATDGIPPKQLLERKENIGPSGESKNRAVMEFGRVGVALEDQSAFAPWWTCRKLAFIQAPRKIRIEFIPGVAIAHQILRMRERTTQCHEIRDKPFGDAPFAFSVIQDGRISGDGADQ